MKKRSPEKFYDLIDSLEANKRREERLYENSEFFEKDIEFLEKQEQLQTVDLVNKISEHLKSDGRVGSAELISMFTKSVILDKELEMVRNHQYKPSLIEKASLPALLDKKTTPEMVSGGSAILTSNAKADFIGSINKLKYRLNEYINENVKEASQLYAEKLTHGDKLINRIKGLFESQSPLIPSTKILQSANIPFTPNVAELDRLRELSNRKYLNIQEIEKTYQRELSHMMKQRPKNIGLGTSTSMVSFLSEIQKETGSNINKEIKIDKLRKMHKFMKDFAMYELRVHPDFAKKIEDAINKDISISNTAESQ